MLLHPQVLQWFFSNPPSVIGHHYYSQRAWITIRTEGHPADHIALINTSFSALSIIANSIETNQREDVRSVATLLYTGGCLLLSRCMNSIDMGQIFSRMKHHLSTAFRRPSLPSKLFWVYLSLNKVIRKSATSGRSMLSSPPASWTLTEWGAIIHVHVVLDNLKLIVCIRGRAGAISSRKTKTNMLAIVLVLTAIPPTVQVGRAAIEHTCFLISQKLLEDDEVGPTNPS